MSTLNYKPIMARVLIKRDKIESKSGIILTGPDGKPRELNTGVVVAIGDAVTHEDIQPGVRVHWGRNAGTNIQPDHLRKDNAEEYFICMEEDILGVINE